MEFIIPAVALGTLYIVSNQEKKKKESFVTNKLGDTWKSSEYPYDTKKNLHDGLNSFTNPNQRQESYNTKETAEKYHNKNCNNEPQIDDKETFTSLTGESIETKDIEHNNMVPFFGSHVSEIIISLLYRLGNQGTAALIVVFAVLFVYRKFLK